MRRTKPEKRRIDPDIRYNSRNVQVLINNILKKGKKSTASQIVYDALGIVQETTKKEPVEVLDAALKNVGPVMEVRPRRVGGATYQVPMEVEPERKLTLAVRWILDASNARSGKSFAEKLAGEVMDAANEQGSAIRKREETHKMAEANRAFSHFRV
ncbi:MAG TPA: 30S ribosomal protein S7 [Anaerolineaceae bacterium]|jgi:small subunit ribosomal protein S7|nr:30S ribosomal protein S7 [Anaerolineaceae bacterium]